ncbi:hypothetical protein FOA43_003841 [Brettanomyces nanus]|uniref:Uncharacterized protein n=1 Tax=Eeniella nana TaxID=13502 RepID=A0A875S9D8_EENNA|nr:uncharacterized protein FOA43_003841 [Brettanomyces nanus]QPG76452.1 hypothetical protein FOA43_003841 [Brettanomyces nanus]
MSPQQDSPISKGPKDLPKNGVPKPKGNTPNTNRTSNRNRRRNGKKNKSIQSNDKERPLFLEIQKLVRNRMPITVNGNVVEDLTMTLDEHIKSLLDDKSNTENVYLSFVIHPSDPDFPYDLDFLNITLSIPQSYPHGAPFPTIVVLNDDIPKGFSANIEIGFKQIVATALHNRNNRRKNRGKKEFSEQNTDDDDVGIQIVGGNDLCGMLQTLDKYLERFLSMEKKETVKIVKVIKRYDQEVLEKEGKKAKQKQIQRNQEQNKKKTDDPATIIDSAILEKRNEEIEIFKQRLSHNHLRVFKDSPQNTTFKLELKFQEGSFTIEVEDSTEIVLKKLPIRLTVPKEYLSNPKRPLKMELDMSNDYNMKMVKSLEDQNLRLIFGKLISNMSSNFNYMAENVAKECCDIINGSDSELPKCYWTITSQLNYFIENIQKFMNLKNNFIKWFEENQTLNLELGKSSTLLD